MNLNYGLSLPKVMHDAKMQIFISSVLIYFRKFSFLQDFIHV